MVTSVTVIILWIVAAITYLIIENESLVILLFFLPVIITILLTGYAGWVSNDYAVVLDISEYNEKNQKRR